MTKNLTGEKMALMSYKAYADERGVSKQAIQDRIKRGTISSAAVVPARSERNPSGHPKLDSEIADKDFFRNSDPVKKISADLNSKKKNDRPSDSELLRQTKQTKAIRPEVVKEEHNGQTVPVVKEPAYEPQANRYVNAKATNEELKSRKIELEVLELEGRLVDVGDVKEKLSTKVQEVRSSLFAMGDRMALQIIGKKDLLEVKTIIKKSINDALASLQKIEDDI